MKAGDLRVILDQFVGSDRLVFNKLSKFRSNARHRRAQRALERQRAYSLRIATGNEGREEIVADRMRQYAEGIRKTLSRYRQLSAEDRVLEVGSGAHGAIFYWGAKEGIGLDPLADHYRALYPWYSEVVTLAAGGENLPFDDESFDIVVCDNVIDHAEDPPAIVREISRVLKPGGCLYFVVNVHHPIYHYASLLHGLWNAIGIRLEITPFADHTVHLTPRAAKRLFHSLPLNRVLERTDRTRTTRWEKGRRPRHLGDRLKRVFYKNGCYEIVAVREQTIFAN